MMASKNDNSIQRALRCVDEAIKYDSGNCDKEAYVKYLESISVISTSLYTDEVGCSRDFKPLSPQQKQRLIDVAKQCLDRLDILFKKLNETDNKPSPTIQVSEEKSLPTSALKVAPDSTESNVHILESINWVAPETANVSYSDNKILSPLEKAQQENKYILATYKRRLTRATTFSAQTNIYLELQRRLTENLQVARKQQEIYLNAIQEKQKRHLNEVTKRVIRGDEAASKEFYRRKELCTKTIEYEKHQAWIAGAKTQLSENPDDVNLVEMIVRHILRDQNHPISEELNRRIETVKTKLLALIEAYTVNEGLISQKLTTEEEVSDKSSSSDVEDSTQQGERQDNVPKSESVTTSICSPGDETLQKFGQSFEQNVQDVELAIKNNNTFRNTLKKSLEKQKQVLRRGSRIVTKKNNDSKENGNNMNNNNPNYTLKGFDLEALQRHLRHIASDAQNIIEEMVEIVSLAYSEMEHGDNHERCYLIIEDHAYGIIWTHLMKLCKLAYSFEEKQMESAIQKLQDCSPDKFGFNSSHTQPSSENYKAAVEQLKQLTSMVNPTKKLEGLVKVAKLLCCKEVSPTARTESPIGADDFIPLLSYVCIQTKTSQLICECQLLEYLINPKHMLGEAGYCLTSLQTALHYIQILNSKRDEV